MPPSCHCRVTRVPLLSHQQVALICTGPQKRGTVKRIVILLSCFGIRLRVDCSVIG